MKHILIAMAVVLSLVACGKRAGIVEAAETQYQAPRSSSKYIQSEFCYQGIVYLASSHGITAKYVPRPLVPTGGQLVYCD